MNPAEDSPMGMVTGPVESPHPKLRADLIAAEKSSDREAHVILKDPGTRRYYKLGAVGYRVARMLDGETGPEGISEKLSRELEIPIPVEAIEKYIEELRQMGFLEGAERPPKPPRNIFYLRFKLLDPERILNGLRRPLYFLFTRWFLLLAGLTLITGVLLLALSWHEVRERFLAGLAWKNMPWYYLSITIMGTLHEFAHGLTLKHFGGEVREMGFLLLYFNPCLYCNVSDSWLLKRRQRLLVTSAGIIFELFAWSIALMLWLTLESRGVAFAFTFGMVMFGGLRSFFNLNPLIKLDGYYLLSDYLEIPNLRARAFSYIWGALRRKPVAASFKEKLTFLIYGPLAALYTASLLSFLAVRLYGYVLLKLGPWGHLLFWVLVLFIAHKPLFKLARRLGKLMKPSKN